MSEEPLVVGEPPFTTLVPSGERPDVLSKTKFRWRFEAIERALHGSLLVAALEGEGVRGGGEDSRGG